MLKTPSKLSPKSQNAVALFCHFFVAKEFSLWLNPNYRKHVCPSKSWDFFNEWAASRCRSSMLLSTPISESQREVAMQYAEDLGKAIAEELVSNMTKEDVI